jgi:hypothetical protein
VAEYLVNYESSGGEERRSFMQDRISIRAGVLLVATLAAPVATAAQSISSPYRFLDTRQEVGIVFGDVSAHTVRFGFGPPGGTVVGVRWGIELSGPLGLEVVATTIDGKRDVIDPARAEGNRRVGGADARLGTVDARLRFSLTGDRTWHDLTPFLLMGGGVVFDASGNQPADTLVDASDQFKFGSSFLGTMGMGVRWMASRTVALRGDGVFSLWKLKTPPGFSDSTLGFVAVEKSEWASALHFTLSAVIRF